MRNLASKRRALWTGVLFFAATAFWCVDAEGQRSRLTDVETITADEEAENESAFENGYSTEPFDSDVKRLPPMYFGHDPEAIYYAVKDLVDDNGALAKRELETTREWENRLREYWRELQDKTLVGNVKFSSTLAFASVGSDALNSFTGDGEILPLHNKYNADSKTLVLNAGNVPRLDWEHKRQLMTFKKGSGKYWGALSSVPFYEVNDYNHRYEDVYLSLRLQSISQEVAGLLQNKVGVLCIGRLRWTFDNDGCSSCYYNGPCAVRITEPEFWLYKVDTGEILAKYSSKETRERKAKHLLTNKILDAKETNAERVERETLEAVEKFAKGRRTNVVAYQDGNKLLDNRLAAVKRLTSSRDVDAPLQIAVPGDCATLQDALAEAAKAPYNGPIPRIVLDAGEYDASGLTLKTFVDVQSASGKPEDVVLTVDAASPITVDGETVVSFDGVALRQVGGGAKSGACVEVKRGVALFFGCAFDGKSGASSATGVKAVGLKSAAVLHKCRATGFSLSALHVEDGAFGWAVESVFGPKNRFGASSKAARLEAEKCEFRGNETALYFRGIATGGASGNQYAENKRDAQIVGGAKVEVDAPNVEEK